MATFWTTFRRQVLAYGGGSLAGAVAMTLFNRLFVPGDHGWPRLDLGRVSFARLPAEIVTTTVANFVFLLLPFLLVRAIVVINAGAISGRVGPIAAAMSGAIPYVVTAVWLTWLLGGASDMNAFSLLITGLGGAILGLAYRRLGGFPEWNRP